MPCLKGYTFLYRQIDFPSEPEVANEILEKAVFEDKVKSEAKQPQATELPIIKCVFCIPT